MKQLKFHSNFARVTLLINGVPYSLYSEVEVTLTKPAKLDKASEIAWSEAKKEGEQAVTLENIPAGKKE